MKCLILAAGKGSRLRQRADSKPLLKLLGVPLIERVIRNAAEAGIREFVVVTGHQEPQVREFLTGLARRLALPIHTAHNPEWQNSENGRSILAARHLLRQEESFLLTMADHLLEPALIGRVLDAAPPPAGGVLLAVDGEIANPLVDREDVTRVHRDDDRITAIGKGLEPFDGYDTGLFLCTPGLFGALERSAERGDSSLSGAVARLAEESRAGAVATDGLFWCDVDDEAALGRAEEALLQRLRGKRHDGPVSRLLNRPLSIRISRWLADSPVTPNQISLFSFALSLLAAWLFTLGGYAALALGGVLAQLASIVDGCDGEIARLKYLGSDFGGWFDAVLDRYADALLLFGLTWHAWREGGAEPALLLGFAAITGSFMLSYTADKYDGLMRKLESGKQGVSWRMGRDLRVFLIMLGAVLHLPLLILGVIALLMNLETLRRIWICRPRTTAP